MLISHKFIDALLQRDPKMLLVHPDADANPEYPETLAACINAAEKFDFDLLPMTPLEDDPGKLFGMEPSADEMEAWATGLLPLPAPLCWYEYDLSGDGQKKMRYGMLIQQENTRWIVVLLQWDIPRGIILVTGDCVILDKFKYPGEFMSMVGGQLLKQLDYIGSPIAIQKAADAKLSIYLTLMINSRSTDIRNERAPAKLNHSRIKRGLTPLPDHRVVRIVPEAYLRAARAEAGKTRLPPRLHWRRSHIRVLHRGEPHEYKTLIPRCLVGIGEAELSHEYRVLTQPRSS